jgi:ABC-type amino acid transport system permease subunit
MFEKMSNTMSVVYVVILVIDTYVLMFSSIPLLYKIVIVVFSFILLLLSSLALQSLEIIGKPRLE